MNAWKLKNKWQSGGKSGIFVGVLVANLERAHETLIHRHHPTGVVEFAAVIGGREERDQLPFGEELIAILHDLMRTTYEIQVVAVQELCHDIRAEREGDTTVIFAPPHHYKTEGRQNCQ